ncbi:MAG: MBL fold metallo-hydrolase RNA specificity domain-containing protein [Candidatus Aminicenantales bacterium]
MKREAASPMKIRFLGAARQVTGSCYALEAGGLRLLVDCGLYQERSFLSRNWDPLPVSARDLDYLLLTHAHLDHSGLIPRLVRQGFRGRILATSATADLLPIMLMDTARIQEEDAAFKKKRHQKEGRQGPFPEVPLYTIEDVQRALPLVEEIGGYEGSIALNDRVTAVFHDAGHILGSSMIEIRVKRGGEERTFVFSGDIGQWDKPIIRDPSVFRRADYVVMETTYGDRDHDKMEDVETLLAGIINRAVQAGGNVVIPTFAVERAQELMFHLSRLRNQKRIPGIMVFLDSPMAVSVTDVFERHPECLDRETLDLFRDGKSPFDFPGLKFTRTTEESKAINALKGSCIIMAGSGMCTGGRVKQHLVQNISRPEATIVFVGFQARETLGRQILEGNPRVRIFGQERPVQARIEKLLGFSAHADRGGLFRWLDAFQSPPRRLFLTHGEKEVPLKLGEDLRRERGWNVEVPDYLDEFDLE